jgi:putative Mn2+ efflux pump MntP
MTITQVHGRQTSDKPGSGGLKILMSGIGLMLVATALDAGLRGSNDSNVTSEQDFIMFMPAVAGALLVFAGGLRTSVTTRPKRAAIVGLILFVVASALPIVASVMSPPLREFIGTGASLIALFTCRIVGLICLSTALLRWSLDRRRKI